jgi:hypothetical protein
MTGGSDRRGERDRREWSAAMQVILFHDEVAAVVAWDLESMTISSSVSMEYRMSMARRR